MGCKAANNRANRKRRVLEEQRYRCAYCWSALEVETATMDHLVPASRGGRRTYENTVAACWPCNQRRGNRHWGNWWKKMRTVRKARFPERMRVKIALDDAGS